MTMTVDVVPEMDQIDAAGEMSPEEQEKLRLTEAAAESARVRDTVSQFVSKDPKYTAGIIRKWMRQKEVKVGE